MGPIDVGDDELGVGPPGLVRQPDHHVSVLLRQLPYQRRAKAITGPFEICGVPMVPFVQDHGFSTTLGIRIGGFAYSTDVTELDDNAFAALADVELWIVDCLRRESHPTHSHLAKTLSWVARVGPRRAVLTHMDQSLDYRELSAELPEGVEPGRDGLVIEVLDPK